MEREREVAQRQALFVRGDTAAQIAAANLGISKSDLLGAQSAGSVAVRAALAEAETLADTREFLALHGVSSESLLHPGNSKASDSVFLVKNLPVSTTSAQLEQLYAPFGALGRVLVVPGGALGIIEFVRPPEARKGYQRTAFSNFGGAPLYLQWAPEGVFTTACQPRRVVEEKKKRNKKEEKTDTEGQAARQGLMAAVAADDEYDAEDSGGAVTVFVKNLNFVTSEAELKAHFAGVEGLRSVTVVERNSRSMGYGFVELANKEAATQAIKRVQGTKLDGHVLELSFSKKQQMTQEKTKSKRRKKNTGGGDKGAAVEVKETPKLVVRNVPFEASKKELQDLFGAYASLKVLRLPLKFDRSHRGYAFAVFESKSEARKAKEALENAHLYGRRLVIEYAEVDKDEEAEEKPEEDDTQVRHVNV